MEVWERLKAAMRDYRGSGGGERGYEAGGGGDRVSMRGGWGTMWRMDRMPLHTTIQYNGWTGANPKGYTTEHKIHAQFESRLCGGECEAERMWRRWCGGEAEGAADDVFVDYVAYLRHSNSLVEKTYQLEKAGGFAGAGTPEGKAFVDERLAAGATELRDMIYTAWVRSRRTRCRSTERTSSWVAFASGMAGTDGAPTAGG